MKKQRPYEDVDSSPDFLDLPRLRYGPDGHGLADPNDVDQRADPKWRRQHGLGPLPKPAPPVEH